MANSQHKYLLERGWSQQQIDEVIRKAHEWLRGAGYTPLTEHGHWNGIMGNTQSYHLPSREKDSRGMTEAFVEMLKGGKILDASRVHKFSRPGAKDTMAVEDRFYFGKERFASNAEWTSDIERNALEWLYILNMAAAGDKSQTTRKKIKQTANDLLEAMARKNSSMSIKAIETAKSLKRSAEI